MRWEGLDAKLDATQKLPGYREPATVRTFDAPQACTYCLAGGSAVLMADGGLRALAQLRPGDLIYGTELTGARRRYVITEVRDRWTKLKPAYRVTLADGTSLVASPDHRLLARSGWRQVTGDVPGGRRRRLSASDQLLGPGAATPGDVPLPGMPVGSSRGLWVDSIEALGEELVLHDLTTGTGDFVANGVVSHNCFARPTHEYPTAAHRPSGS